MIFDESHKSILKDIQTFSSIKRYRGMLPCKLAVFEEDKAMELVEEGFIERVSVSFSCGSEGTFYRLTKLGTDYLEGNIPVEDATDPEEEWSSLSETEQSILHDIYHFSLIHRFGGMMPTEEQKHYDPKSLNKLFMNGYIIRIKADMGKSLKRKGLILSERGQRVVLAFGENSH